MNLDDVLARLLNATYRTIRPATEAWLYCAMKLNKRFYAETRNEMNFSSPFFILFLFLYIFFLARSYIFTQVKNRDTEIIVCDNNSNYDSIHEISIILFITACQKIIIKIISIV